MVPAGSPPPPFSPTIKRPLQPPNPTDLKKTRHLPNLSDCYSCGRHVTPSNPTLHILDSLWRIVLLCTPCHVSIRSALSCSYCFSPAAASDSHRCPSCLRRVHHQCAARYASSPPWSFCSNLGFSVCVDCWAPKSLYLANRKSLRLQSEVEVRNSSNFGKSLKYLDGEIRVPDDRGKKKKKMVVTKSDTVCENGKILMLCSEGEDKVLSESKKGKKKIVDTNPPALSDKGCKDRKDLKSCSEGARVSSDVAAARAKEKAAVAKEKTAGAKEKTAAAKRALEFAKKKGESEKSQCASNGPGLGDAELAIRLHRAMNSSPRISRRFLFGNSSGLDSPSVRVDNKDSLVRALEPKKFNLMYKRRGSYSQSSDDATCSEPSVSLTSSEDNLKSELLVYKRKIQVKEEVIPEHNGMVLENQICHKQDPMVYRRKCKKCDESQVKEQVFSENDVILENQVGHSEDVLVYRRKCRKTDGSQLKDENCFEDGMILENQIGHTQDVLVYRRKCKKCNESQVKNEIFSENEMILENEKCPTQDVLVYRRKGKTENGCQEKGEGVHENSVYLENQSCHTECNSTCNEKLDSSDRYLFKYNKRSFRSKDLTNGDSIIMHDGPCAESVSETTGITSENI